MPSAPASPGAWDGLPPPSGSAERDGVMTLGRALRELEASRQSITNLMNTIARLTEAHAATVAAAAAGAREEEREACARVAESGRAIRCSFDNCGCGGPDDCQARRAATPDAIAAAIRARGEG